ncbi:MAG TPA: glycosyltransferase family 4 protein [Candidatus Binataceae bacterium]|nr:glycosyltransferase family 4 protein [Candidatus Binataceae bacterium]
MAEASQVASPKGNAQCPRIKVAVASAAPFWAFDLARQMERLGHLARLYTAYPRFKVDGLPAGKVSTFPWLMGPATIAGRFGMLGLRERLNMRAIETFDRWMAARVEPCEVFHCLSSFGLESHRAARARHGALTVCDRGSSHIVFQNEILREEYARFDIPFRGTDQRILDRELAEYEFCDLISVPSSFAMRSFLEYGVPREKLRLNPYGVDLSMFHPMPKRDSVFRILFVGSISIRKGIAYLLEAAKRAAIAGLDLVLIGSMDDDTKKTVGNCGVPLRHLGVLPRGELAGHYSQASVLVLPSIEDGFGLVMAQAMACGVPVIATTNTGAEDLFTDRIEGFIVPIRDAAAIADKLVFLHEHPDIRDAMGAAALARVQSLGGWSSYGERMAAMYQTALAGRRLNQADANSVR